MMVSTTPCAIQPSSLSTTGTASVTRARSSLIHAGRAAGECAEVGSGADILPLYRGTRSGGKVGNRFAETLQNVCGVFSKSQASSGAWRNAPLFKDLHDVLSGKIKDDLECIAAGINDEERIDENLLYFAT